MSCMYVHANVVLQAQDMLNFQASHKAAVSSSDPSQHHDAWKNHLEPQQTQSDAKVTKQPSELSTKRLSSHCKPSLMSALASRTDVKTGHRHQSNVDVFGKMKIKDFFNVDRFKVFGEN